MEVIGLNNSGIVCEISVTVLAIEYSQYDCWTLTFEAWVAHRETVGYKYALKQNLWGQSAPAEARETIFVWYYNACDLDNEPISVSSVLS